MSTATSQRTLDIPSRIDDIISSSITELKTSLTLDIGPTFRNVTVLYYDPRLGAYFHLVPGQHTSLGGPASDYFKKFIDLKPRYVMPRPADIAALIAFAATRPHVSSAIRQMMLDDTARILGISDGSASSGQFLTRILDIFTKPEVKPHFNAIHRLFSDKKLSRIIHTLLMLLPQYPQASGSAMFSPSVVEDASHSSKLHWVNVNDKVMDWQHVTNDPKRRRAATPSTRLFFLLSAVESLLWDSNTILGSIHNIYSYLQPRLIHNTAGRLRMALSGLSAYVVLEANKEDSATLKKYEAAIFRTLYEHIDVLSVLSATIAMSQVHRERGRSDEMNNWPSSAIAQGLLGFIAPKTIQYRDTYVNVHGEMCRRDMALERGDPAALDSDSSRGVVSPLLQSCLNTWGVYQPTTHTVYECAYTASCDNERPFGVCRTGDTIRICTPSGADGAHVQCTFDTEEDASLIEDSSLFSGSVLGRLCSESLHVRNTSPEWYEEAFGELYVAFDKLRQKQEAPQFTLRQHETAFYSKLLEDAKKSKAAAMPLRVLDVGIGYGRLAAKILSLENTNIELHGLDISQYMLDVTEKELCIERDRLHWGDMQDVADYLPQDYFDLVIVAFTTFGCYASHEAHRRTLAGIASVLCPGGTLIIEQFHADGHTPDSPMILDETVEGRHIRLTKHTHIVPAEDDMYSQYMGEYLYSFAPPTGTRLFRRDAYCVRLYTDDWFRTELPQAGFDITSLTVLDDFGQDTGMPPCLHTLITRMPRSSEEAAEVIPAVSQEKQVDYKYLMSIVKEFDRAMTVTLRDNKVNAVSLLTWIEQLASSKVALDEQRVAEVRRRYIQWNANPSKPNANTVIQAILELRKFHNGT